MKKLSARHFKDPLILTLGEMSQYTPGYPIYFKDTYEAVAQKMGISLEDYGHQPSTGQLWVTQWIGFAFKALRTSNPPMCQQNMKGRWELTEAGIDRARRLSAMNIEVETNETVSTETVTPTKKEPVVEGGVTLNLTPAVAAKAAVGYYHTDPYLRGLAIEATRCFGGWSSKSATCKRCPLVKSCKESMAISLSALSRRLNLVEIEESKPVETPVEETPTAEVESTQETEGEAQRIQNVPVATECYVCNTSIEKGAECYWVKPHGMCHIDCYKAS